MRSVFETARADAVAQRFAFQRPIGTFGREHYYRYEATAGFRLTRDLALRGGYLVRKGYVVFHWDDQAVVNLVWQRKLL